MVKVSANGNEHDKRQWLGIRTEEQTYCENCGECPEWCQCDKPQESEGDEQEDK